MASSDIPQTTVLKEIISLLFKNHTIKYIVHRNSSEHECSHATYMAISLKKIIFVRVGVETSLLHMGA